MKVYLGLISAAVLTLAACGGEAPAPAAPAAPASEVAPVVSEVAASVEAPAASEASSAPAAAAPAAGECSVTISSNDAMQYDTKEITVKSSCGQFTVNLKHAGTQPVAAMGHNVVVAKAADKNGIVADGATAGAAAGYLKAGDERVIAATKLIGGGEETSVTFDTAKLTKDGSYEFFCTFPGHLAMMTGKVNVVD